MDPFPTYQSAFPRSNKDDEENPFIQFRRFADEQVSSIFSGFPHLFGLSPSSSGRGDNWKKEVEDIMRERLKWEEGFRKQFEQEMEEMRQQLEKSKGEAWKSMEDAWQQHAKPDDKKDELTVTTPWWTRGKAVNCPAINGLEPKKNATKCPALYDEKGQPRTELDAYNALHSDSNKQIQIFQAPADEKPKKSATSWLPTLGWDGQQKDSASAKAPATLDYSTKNDRPLGRPTTYSLWGARRMRPFENADETIPWLMLSPYSPIYLCNPAQSRLFKVRIQDSEGAPLQISGTRFFERWYTDVDEKMATQKPWADAFEDLLSLQQTGEMVDRNNWNTWRTPRTWIHDMANRGSLGERWGFNDQGMLVKRADTAKMAPDTPTPSKEDGCARWRKTRECRRNKSTEPLSEEAEKPAENESILIDSVTGALAPFPLFGSIMSAADAIVSAVDRAAQKETRAQVESSVAAPTITGAHNNDDIATSSSNSSSSATSCNYDSSATASTKSLLSTLTSTVTRTLPDGSTETKRILKRRFADGSEESDESVEVQTPARSTSASNMASSAVVTGTEDRETQTQARPEARQLQELEGSRPQLQFPRRVTIVSENETQPKASQNQMPVSKSQHGETKATPEPEQDYQSQNSNNNIRGGGGWFWN